MPSPSASSPGDDPTRDTTEARIAKALAPPLRARILERLADRVASPGELASELGVPLGVAAYHIRMLRQYECIELVRTEPVRGALQHFYTAAAQPHFNRGELAALPPALRAEIVGHTVRAIIDDVR